MWSREKRSAGPVTCAGVEAQPPGPAAATGPRARHFRVVVGGNPGRAHSEPRSLRACAGPPGRRGRSCAHGLGRMEGKRRALLGESGFEPRARFSPPPRLPAWLGGGSSSQVVSVCLRQRVSYQNRRTALSCWTGSIPAAAAAVVGWLVLGLSEH